MLLSKVIILLLVLVWGCTACLFYKLQPALFHQTYTICRHVFLGGPLYSPLRRSPEGNNTVFCWIHKAVVNPVPSPLHLDIDVFCLCHLQSCLVWNLLDCFGVLYVISHQSGVFSDPRLVFFSFPETYIFLLISHKPSCAAPIFPRYLKSR